MVNPVLLAVLAATLITVPQLQADSPSEGEIKAAFLYHFAQFTDWPASAVATNKAFIVCLVGSDSGSSIFRSILAGKVLRGQPVAFRVQLDERSAEDCNLMFIAGAERKHFPAILSRVSGRPVLTVGDWPQFTADGGIIGFYIADEKIRFEVNMAAAGKAGLVISSQVLRLARIVNARKD